MLILDTNHSREVEFRSTIGMRLVKRISASSEDAVITAITVEEQLRGRLAEIRRHTAVAKQVAAYAHLVRQVELHARWTVLPWDDDAVLHHQRLVKQCRRVGAQDLKIAAIAIAHDALLLTRNTGDFVQIPGLKFANWLE